MRAARRYAVVGDPVAHSASPRLFAAMGRRLGLELDYRAERVTSSDFPAFLAGARAAGYRGLSVTLPHKEAALALADDASDTAHRVGAANCLLVEAGRLVAHNTDALGLVRALAGHGASLSGAHVVLLGAGGAARAAAHAAQASGAAALWVSNRTATRAAAVAEAFGGLAVPLEPASLQPCLDRADVLIQASAAGLGRPTETALPAGCVLHGNLTVLDMVYQPLETALLRAARAAGAQAVDGLWMLVHQAVEQLRLWTGAEAPPELAASVHRELQGEGGT
ncbi:MAG: shikimate dehydrogenase [Myxococcaceae bacterium]